MDDFPDGAGLFPPIGLDVHVLAIAHEVLELIGFRHDVEVCRMLGAVQVLSTQIHAAHALVQELDVVDRAGLQCVEDPHDLESHAVHLDVAPSHHLDLGTADDFSDGQRSGAPLRVAADGAAVGCAVDPVLECAAVHHGFRLLDRLPVERSDEILLRLFLTALEAIEGVLPGFQEALGHVEPVHH